MSALPLDWSHFGLVEERLDWQERGLCAQTDPEAFFPEKGASSRQAKATCNGIPGETDPCPVRAECLAYALKLEREYGRMPGVWGGLSAEERRQGLKKVGRLCAWGECQAEVPRAADGKYHAKYCSEEHRDAAHREAKARYDKAGRLCKLPGCENERGWSEEGVERGARGARTKYCSEEHRREHMALLASKSPRPVLVRTYTDDLGRLRRVEKVGA